MTQFAAVPYKDISRVDFINNFDLGGRLGEDYLYSDTGQDYRHFPSQMFEASLAQIPKFSKKTFRRLFLLQAVTLELICGSGISSKRFFTGVACVGVDLLILPCIDSWTNEYSDPRFRILREQGLQMRLDYFSHFNFLADLC